jgi:ubiquinone biosynthesis protein UbiJ
MTEDSKELKRIALNLSIQIHKLMERIDRADGEIGQCYHEIDAIKFDIEMFERRLETLEKWTAE